MTEVRLAATQDELAAALALRHLVFVVEQGVAPDLELDGRDGDADHVVAFDGAGRLVGTCRLLHDPETATTKLGRMAVERPARGRGIAAELLAEAERVAREAGSTAIALSAQVTAEGVYARAGYVAVGEVYEEAGLDHRDMRKEL